MALSYNSALNFLLKCGVTIHQHTPFQNSAMCTVGKAAVWHFKV